MMTFEPMGGPLGSCMPNTLRRDLGANSNLPDLGLLLLNMDDNEGC